MSIIDYIHRQKMREAAHLLRQSSYSIADISSFLQYTSQSYFTRVFHDLYNVTPQQYREGKG